MQVATAYSFPQLHRSNSHPLKLVAFGDSLIYGFGDGVGGGWVERLRRQWMCPDSPGHVLSSRPAARKRVSSPRRAQKSRPGCHYTFGRPQRFGESAIADGAQLHGF